VRLERALHYYSNEDITFVIEAMPALEIFTPIAQRCASAAATRIDVSVDFATGLQQRLVRNCMPFAPTLKTDRDANQ